MDITIIKTLIEQNKTILHEVQLQISEIARLLNIFGLQTISAQLLLQLGIILPPDQPPPQISEYQKPSEEIPSSKIPINLLELDRIFDNRTTDFKKREAFPGSSGDDDNIFEHRITTPEEFQKIIQALRSTYKKPIRFLGGTDRWDEFEGFIQKTLNEIATIISHRKPLISLIKEAIIIAPSASFGEVIGNLYINKLKKWSKTQKNPYGIAFTNKMELVQNYLQKVSQSRLEEIASNTHIRIEEVRTLLIAGMFTHHKTCFWRFADQISIENSSEGVIIRKGNDAIAVVRKREKNSQERYQERYFDFKKEYGNYPLIKATIITEEIWKKWELKALELIKTELQSGWEIDPKRWGASCLNYEQKRINLLSESKLTLGFYIFLGLITYGVGFFTFFLFYRNSIELKGVKIWLVMKQKVKSKDKDGSVSKPHNRLKKKNKVR